MSLPSKLFSYIITTFGKQIVALICGLFIFFSLANVYKWSTGIGIERFQSTQIDSVIKNDFNDQPYEIIKVNFSGYSSDLVAITDSAIANSGAVKPQIVIYENVQKDFFETIIFQQDLYSKKDEIVFEFNQSAFLRKKVMNDIGLKQRLFFCFTDTYCGFLNLEGSSLEIKPIALSDPNRKDYCHRDATVKTSKGEFKMSAFPFGSDLFFKNSDKELYIASPLIGDQLYWNILDDTTTFYSDDDSKHQQQICRVSLSPIPEHYSSHLFFSGNKREHCYRTKDDFFEPFNTFGYWKVSYEEYVDNMDELDKEISKNIGLPALVRHSVDVGKRMDCK